MSCIELPHNDLGNAPADWQDDPVSVAAMKHRVVQAVARERDRRVGRAEFRASYIDLCRGFMALGRELSARDRAVYEQCLAEQEAG